MALDGGYYGSFEHAMANLAIGRRQGEEEGYKKGFSEGYNKAIQEANQRIAELTAALDREVKQSNMHVTFAAPARAVLSALIRENPDHAAYIRAMFRNEYIAEVQDSLSKGQISVPPEQHPDAATFMPKARQFILEALQG